MKVRFIFTILISQFGKHLQVANVLKFRKSQLTSFWKSVISLDLYDIKAAKKESS